MAVACLVGMIARQRASIVMGLGALDVCDEAQTAADVCPAYCNSNACKLPALLSSSLVQPYISRSWANIVGCVLAMLVQWQLFLELVVVAG